MFYQSNRLKITKYLFTLLTKLSKIHANIKSSATARTFFIQLGVQRGEGGNPCKIPSLKNIHNIICIMYDIKLANKLVLFSRLS